MMGILDERFLILASASPRRRSLLSEAGYRFIVDPSDVHEPEPDAASQADPKGYALHLALNKARAVALRHARGLILAADTVCSVAGEILNKPIDRADADRMIRLQEGNETDVLTAIVLQPAGRDLWVAGVERSTVYFRPLTERERADHLDSGRWEGKSGAYGVQDNDPYIRLSGGSHSNVVGLPMERLAALLREHPSLWDP
ncbi:MAG: Maf family nucleotide pyrophosphatase [Isosphaeraceae bacterium]